LRFEAVRRHTLALCAPLQIEDYGVQPMADASPPKWHLAHTTWFFERFVLKPHVPGYTEFHSMYERLFNSYYNAVCEPFPRADRGHLSRPTVNDTLAYRAHVDGAMATLLEHVDESAALETIVLGIHHEQQHQELLLTDIKCILGFNPLAPAYHASAVRAASATQDAYGFCDIPGGAIEIGHAEGTGFAFDNEQPAHLVLLQPYRLGTRLVANGEFLEFVLDDGYRRPEFWLSDGWDRCKRGQLGPAPLYWRQQEGRWFEYRLDGNQPLVPHTPVVHVSFFEADAYARWKGARLPTEFEWENAATTLGARNHAGNFVESGVLHPTHAHGDARARRLMGDAWEWTPSAYHPYPGFRARAGALGEYNGKFMSNQMVLRGGSCATPQSHIRTTYRNFFYPQDRWQFSGIRLAQDL